MNELSLFSGAGGGLLASRLLGWRTIGYVEWDEYCQRVIAARIAGGFLDAAPIFTDVRQFVESGTADQYRGFVDVVSGGFPCQPFSVAGKRAGADDHRNMWPATIECIRRVQPRYAFLENVPGLLTSGYFGTILGDLAESGYDCRWRVLSAAEVGAPHRRDRLWILAYRRNERPEYWTGEPSKDTSTFGCWSHYAERGASNGDGRHVPHSNGAERGRNGAERGSHRRDTQLAGNGEPGHVADADSGRCEQRDAAERAVSEFDAGDIRNAEVSRLEGADAAWDSCADGWPSESGRRDWSCDWWKVESDVGRVVDGMAYRVDRLRAIGNGQVALCAALAFLLLAGGES